MVMTTKVVATLRRSEVLRVTHSASITYLFHARYEFERACDVVVFTGKDAAVLIARYFTLGVKP